MPTHASNLVDEIVKVHVAPVFKRLAYRKVGLSWSKEAGDLVRMAAVQGSAGNTHASARFTLNLGLFHDALYRELEDGEPPPKLSVGNCRPQTRLNAFLGGHDHWFEVTADNANEVGVEVARLVETHVVQWLEGASTLGDALERLVALEDLHPAAICAWLLQRDDAGELVSRAVTKIRPQNERYAEMIEAWARTRGIIAPT